MRTHRQRGFTFIEMMVVMLIIALAMGIAVPMVEGGFDSREVRRAARQIASTMHYCRGEALATGTPQELIIDPNQNRIETTGGRWAVLTDRAVMERVLGGAVLGDGAVQVLFFPNGSTSGAEVIIASRRDRFQNRLRIRLDPLIGRVQVGDAT